MGSHKVMAVGALAILVMVITLVTAGLAVANDSSFIGGGTGNTANGHACSVSGGQGNVASGGTRLGHNSSAGPTRIVSSNQEGTWRS